MTLRWVSAALVAMALGIAAGCAGESSRTEGDPAARTAPPPAASASVPAPRDTVGTASDSCASTGAWQACSVTKRLTDAGFVPIEKGTAPSGVFDVPGTTYTLGPAELHVYLFASAAARERALASVDTVAVARPGTASPWALPPTLVTSNNLAAVLVSDNGRLIERVQNAITAGLPSASR